MAIRNLAGDPAGITKDPLWALHRNVVRTCMVNLLKDIKPQPITVYTGQLPPTTPPPTPRSPASPAFFPERASA